MQQPTIMGIDLGYVQLKAVANHWSGICPSIVKKRSEIIASGIADSEGYLITGQNGTWNVGSKGSYDFKAERLTSDSDIPKLLTMLGLFNEDSARSTIDLIVSGLPVDDFKIKDFKDEFNRRLQGNFRFGFGDKLKNMSISKAITLPQSAGAFFDYILDDDGDENASSIALASEDVLVLDIGGKSADGCIMEQALFSQDSFTIWQGIWKVHSELRKLIMRKFRYNMPPHKLDAVLRTGKAKIGEPYEDVRDLCKTAVETVFPELRDELSLYVPDFRRFSAVLTCGGGSYVYNDYIEELVGIPVYQLPNAEFANANGYRKYGALKMQEGIL
jgi:plasmid segregation protein ParM